MGIEHTEVVHDNMQNAGVGTPREELDVGKSPRWTACSALLRPCGNRVGDDSSPVPLLTNGLRVMSDEGLHAVGSCRDLDWNSAVGPFFDDDGVRAQLGITQGELDVYVANSDVLMVVTTDDVSLFPVFQFGEHGETLPGLRSVVRLLLPIVDDSWDVALWLNTKSTDFDGLSAAELLRGNEVDRVLRIAERDGSILDR
jgi:hypothetical protein